MKKDLLLYIGLTLALLTILISAAGCDSFASPSTTKTSASGAILSQQNTGIWVSGEGKINVAPDLGILNLGVEAQATTVAEANSQAAWAMDAVTRELDNHGIAKKDVMTQQFSIYPVRRWVEKEEQEVLIGYRVNNMITAKIRKLENAGTIIDAVTRVGGDYIRINGISFTVDDPSAYYEEVRERAMADAGKKAKQLADLAGVKLGQPTYINESGVFIPVPIMRSTYAEAAPAAAPPPSISPGETEIRLTVQVVYSMK